MDLSILTEEELRIFLEKGLPLWFHRNIYAKNNKLGRKLKGFRFNNAPESMLVNTSMRLIEQEKNPIIMDLLNKFYEGFKKDNKKNEDYLIKSGYPDDIAHSLSIIRGCNEEFLPIYFKLEGITEKEQQKIVEDNNAVNLIEAVCSKNNDKINTLEDRIDKNGELIEEIKKSTRENIAGISKTISQKETDLINVTDVVKSIENDYVTKEAFNSKILNMEKISKKTISELLEKFDETDAINEIQNQINDIKKELQNRPKTTNDNTVIANSINNENFEVMDDYLRDNIGDVIEDLCHGDKFDVFREYLIEVIYSKKPIIVPTRNANFLCQVLSAVISGGNYHVLSISDNCNDDELIEKIEKLPTVNGNKVVLIKNKFNVSDCGHLLDYIKSKPFTEKYIFEILYDKEAYFFPIEFLDKFNFYFGKIQLSTIKYKYSYDFKNDNKIAAKNSDFTRVLESIGVNLSEKEIINVKFYGLLAYSIIPFFAINTDTDEEELINRILDPDIRKKCEACLYD